MSDELPIDGNGQPPFEGFEPLEANFVFCPNQFFDLVIPNYSRPVVRLVSFILYETLRWLDDDGSPVRQDIAVSFNDLVTRAGISRGSIRKAIAEAVHANLIKCIKPGRSKTSGDAGQVGEYSLNWDDTGHYAKTQQTFAGFYLGQGNRSPIPHSFFTHVLPQEPLAVTKVVATVLRYTVGYQNQYGGGRRTEAHLSFTMIHRYAKIASPNVVSSAIEHAIASKYIRRVQPGRFTFDSGRQASAIFAVNWLHQDQNPTIGSKSVADDWFKKCSRTSVQKLKQDEFKNHSSISSKTVAGDRYKNRSTIKNHTKKTTKEKQTNTAEINKSEALLIDAGFDPQTASTLSQNNSSAQIKGQIAWLRYRDASQNPLGLLRKAIEETWPEPSASIARRKADECRQQEQREQKSEAERQTALREEKKLWIDRWFAASPKVRQKCKQTAVESETSPIVKARLQKKSIKQNPPAGFLLAFKQLPQYAADVG